MNKTTGIFYSSLIILFMSFGFSVLMYNLKNNDTRRVFFFELIDKPQLCIEDRYVHHVEGQTDVQLFVKELVLGPISDRYRPLFPRDTTVLSCFILDDQLYINLSENAALATGIVTDSVDVLELLNKNIYNNITNINKVNLFIAGKKVYEEDDQKQRFQIKSR